MYIEIIKTIKHASKGMQKGAVRQVSTAAGNKFIEDKIAKESTEEDYEKFKEEYYKENKKPTRLGGIETKMPKGKLSDADRLRIKENDIEKGIVSIHKSLKSAKASIVTCVENEKTLTGKIAETGDEKQKKAVIAKLGKAEKRTITVKEKVKQIESKLKSEIAEIEDDDLRERIEAKLV